MSTWASRISDLTSRGMTYADIGDAIGLAPSTVGDLASGRSKSPRGDAAVKLSELHSARVSKDDSGRHRRRAASAGATAEATTTVLSGKVA